MLDELPQADADYNSSRRDECLPGTRAGIKSQIMSHLSNPSSRFICLNGDEGSGKTAIAKSVARELDNAGRLAASFFFDKARAKYYADSPDRFVPTLVRQLADFDPRYRRLLHKILSDNPGLLSLSGGLQIRPLLLDPMMELWGDSDVSNNSSVIVLDALTECGVYEEDCSSLMEIVVQLALLPKKFQVFLSFRLESSVYDALLASWIPLSSGKVDSLNPSDNMQDVKEYLGQSIGRFPCQGSNKWPPTNAEIEQLAEACGWNFGKVVGRMKVLEVIDPELIPDTFRDLIEGKWKGDPRAEKVASGSTTT